MSESNREYIVISGARENNLQNVSLRIPKRKITIFTGVSGSGKSSIVFDTIAAESTRLLNENFSMFVRSFLPRVPQPDTDAIENLSMAVIVDQKRLGGGSHSTMGTITDISPILRLLFSRAGQPYVGESNMFSFNDPQGMCPECNGIGRKLNVDMDKAVDLSKSLNEGAIKLPDYKVDGWDWSLVVQAGPFDPDKKLSHYSDEELEKLLYSKAKKVKMDFAGKATNVTVEGVIEKFTNKYIKQDLKTKSERTQKAVAPFITEGTCSTCHGSRLSQATLSCKINGFNIAEMSSMEVGQLIRIIHEVDIAVAAPIIKSLSERLQHLVDIGLDYLTLDRETDTLSGGESQRVKMVKHLSGSLVDVTYIFDEPSVGLHPRDVHRLNELLQKLRDKGNTVIVVEHDPDVIKVADHIVDVGPHAGSHGGTIVYEGSFQGLLESGTLTGTHMKRPLELKHDTRQPSGKLSIKNATLHNLKDVNVTIPTGVLTVVTGVAGSGKSTLINDVFLSQNPDAIVIDQSAVGVSTRSNPATYTGIMDDVRKAFASANKVNKGLFSFNSKGACENCQGLGVVYTDLAFLESVKLPCEVCRGRRFKEEVLAYKLNGKSIAEVLEMTVERALEFFEQKEIVRKLQAMSDVGLDYITLGQPLSTLSGGECQRIKLASELHKQGSIYVMDEPTTGLHMSDIGLLLTIMNRLVDAGNTVIVIEHNLDVISQADWIIDMGPDGGSNGGEVVFEGTPSQIIHAEQSITGKYLA
ncbi:MULTISPECIES: ATP-binding cassette domain-containing protein [Shouchella]|uniref:ATP-binding cassette domain-containing protein n=1 Tax=Shouchella TaxID=2893057 RepID=UPI000BA62675|nr:MULTISPECIES: excinuclease ABC subunit UvrA [Shouchella]MCM3314220.1 excinuclease ABC subunit UvrA [Psychrobacillus sp. MER TA 17]MBX0317021.1 excinuclease ABC subunit UvrA [Shouchella clausii]MCM3379854.1 excinuclease ABC subunit UvrA [Shouchella rhizosphaerae]MCZ1180988.1 excinuclease ABC subunit UvrA [Shouchella clausii]PAE82307.1 thiamine ABC transporter permease [Shouchella clausii]